MKIQPACLPCILRMSIEPLIMHGIVDTQQFNSIVRELFREMGNFEDVDSPPVIITRAHRIIKNTVGITDLYHEIKKRDIDTAKRISSAIDKIYPDFSTMDMKTALLISAIGNTLDSGISLDDQLSGNLNIELDKGFAVFDVEIFIQKLQRAESILILGDNIGEVVLDKYLIEKLKPRKIYYAVRNEPILNDAAISDISEISANGVHYISTGSDICGVVLSLCSDEFRKVFTDTDIVISKGMGNYETLSDCEKEIFYLLKAKCATMAKQNNTAVDDYIFSHIVHQWNSI